MGANRRGTGSDLAKVDAYENTPSDYAELPELDDAFFEGATTDLDHAARRGRPPVGEQPKQAVSLRLDVATLERFKATGPGWRTRMNDALAEAAGRLPAPPRR